VKKRSSEEEGEGRGLQEWHRRPGAREICLDQRSSRCESLQEQMISFSCLSCLRFGPLQLWQWCLFSFAILLEMQLSHSGLGAEPNSIARELSSGISVRHSLPVASDGMFLSSEDGHEIWDKTVKTVAADWPIIKMVPPDFDSVPPRAGKLESAWVEVPHAAVPGDMMNGFDAPWPHWPQQRQRVVVQVLPAANGAWVDAVVETQPLAANDASLMPDRVVLTGGWVTDLQGRSSVDATVDLAQRMEFESDPVYALPTPPEIISSHKTRQLPWEGSRFPRLSRTGRKIFQDYKNFYSCENLACVTAAFGAGALMANTGFDTTMQNAWQAGITGSQTGDFFSATKDIGDGIYLLPAAGIAAAAGVALEGVPVGDALGGWGSRSLRIFLVGGPPVYVLQLATVLRDQVIMAQLIQNHPLGAIGNFFKIITE